jgi:hypothetical protein
MYNFATLPSMLDVPATGRQPNIGLHTEQSQQQPAASTTLHNANAAALQQQQQHGPELQMLNPIRQLLAVSTARQQPERSAARDAAAASANNKLHHSSAALGSVGISPRDGDLSLSQPQRLLRAAFYVWVNCMNLVAISSLWARCADAFCPAAAARCAGAPKPVSWSPVIICRATCWKHRMHMCMYWGVEKVCEHSECQTVIMWC